jgi:thiol-disulfide isomerase/thioredoxin
MTLKPAFAAALLALFAAACQPAGQEAANEATTAPAGEVPALASFKKGQFEKLDLDQDMMAPTSPFVDAEGKPHTFAEFKGKILVYNMWGVWCAPCVEEMPSLAGLAKAFAGKDVVVVPVAAGSPDQVEATRKKLTELTGETFQFFYDERYNVNADAKQGGFPATLIYDREGKEVARLGYPAKWDAPDAIALVQAVLDGAK